MLQKGFRQAILMDRVVSKMKSPFHNRNHWSPALLVRGAGDDVASKSVGDDSILPTLVRNFKCLSLFETLLSTVEGSKWSECS
jgi:hypothetical protein